MAEAISSYAEFWPHYLRAHRDPRTRLAHYFATALGLVLVLFGAIAGDWRLVIAAPLAGYAAARRARISRRPPASPRPTTRSASPSRRSRRAPCSSSTRSARRGPARSATSWWRG